MRTPSQLLARLVVLVVPFVASALVTQAYATDTLLSGYGLTLKDSTSNTGKRALALSSKDPLIVGLPSVTTLGATVRVVGTTFDATYALPAGNWVVGTGGKLRYRDTHTLNGPIRTADLYSERFRMSGKGSQLMHTLATDPGPVSLVFTSGSDRYCLEFGTTKFRADKIFTSRGAAAPAVCY